MVDIAGKNILVTGGTGFVGSHLVEELIKEGANVVSTYLTDNPASYFYSKKHHEKVKMVNVDINDFDKFFDIVTKNEIEFIFHLAAQPLVTVAYYNPRRTLVSNVIGTVNVLEAIRLYKNIEGAIIASSDKAYGKLDKNKYRESDSLKGDHPYEVSKSAADLIAQSYAKTYNVPVIVTRFGNIYGEGDLNFSRIIPDTIRSLIQKRTLKIRSDGTFVRDYLYVKDVVRGYLILAEKFESLSGNCFNFGSSDTMTVLEVVKTIEKALNKKIKYTIQNSAKNEIPYQSLDFSKIQKSTDWKPIYSLKKTMPSIYKWYKKNLNGKK